MFIGDAAQIVIAAEAAVGGIWYGNFLHHIISDGRLHTLAEKTSLIRRRVEQSQHDLHAARQRREHVIHVKGSNRNARGGVYRNDSPVLLHHKMCLPVLPQRMEDGDDNF